MNNFANVDHFEARNAIGTAYIKSVLAVFNKEVLKEKIIGVVTMGVLKTIARAAFGALPLFRVKDGVNGIETFQMWYNEFAETNNIALTIRVTGVWSEETQAAFDFIVARYNATV